MQPYWNVVSGIDSPGPVVWKNLQELKAGQIEKYEDQLDVLLDLYRDGVASTAGYAAIPELITSTENLSARLSWEMAHIAGLIIGSAQARGALSVPQELFPHVSADTTEMAIERLLETASRAHIGIPELVDTFAVIVILRGRNDLREKLEKLVLGEYGSAKDNL